jgi:restriction system protein
MQVGDKGLPKNMWMVRAGEGAFLIDDFKKKGIIAIGWNEISDISGIKRKDKIKKLVEEANIYKKKLQIAVAAGQIGRFLLDFKKEDYVVTYDPTNRVYFVGKIQSDYEYNKTICEYHHVRMVKWLGEVSRDKLSIKTKNSLGSISTIFEIKDSAKKEILTVLEGKQPIKDEVPDAEEEEALKEDMASRAHELIKDKIIELEWNEMQELVAGILRAMGHKTLISNVGPDRGNDIEASPDGLMLKEPRILVQVKHRTSQMGAKEIRNFQPILRGRKGLYISTGGFSKDAKLEAERSNDQLTLIDSDRLIQLIIQYYDNFDVETRQLIPLTKIYWPT